MRRICRSYLAQEKRRRPSGDFEAESGDRTFELREGNAQGLIFNIRAADVSAQWEAPYARQQTEVETH